MSDFLLQIEGYCPICEKNTLFTARDQWYRGSLSSPTCENGSVPRERAVALILNEQFPNWRDLVIHECSPAIRGISAKMKREAKNITQTHFYPDLERGSTERNYRNEDLQRLTFSDNQFDLFISLDVMEHIPDPEAAFKEIHRTLKPGGFMLCTWPVRKDQVEAMEPRVTFNGDGTLTHHKPAGGVLAWEENFSAINNSLSIAKLMSEKEHCLGNQSVRFLARKTSVYSPKMPWVRSAKR